MADEQGASTAKSAEHRLSPREIELKLTEILETWPIYRKFHYKGKALQEDRPDRERRILTYGMLPLEIAYYCPSAKCSKPQQWFLRDSKEQQAVLFSPSTFKLREYYCRNCGQSTLAYLLLWYEAEGEGTFMKAGQHPPLSHHPPKELASRLDEEDKDFYIKALDSRNFNYGLGALAYLRRILENRVNDLLDLIEGTARQEGASAEVLDELRKAKESKSFDQKIAIAEKVIPSRLIPEGSNPFARLHDLSSAGIHGETEDECIEIFDHAKLAFEHLFGQLEHEKLSRENFIKSIKALERKAQERKRSGG